MVFSTQRVRRLWSHRQILRVLALISAVAAGCLIWLILYVHGDVVVRATLPLLAAIGLAGVALGTSLTFIIMRIRESRQTRRQRLVIMR